MSDITATNLEVRRLAVSSEISPENIDQTLIDVWQELQSNAASRNFVAQNVGMDPEELVWQSPPFVSRTGASNFGVCTTILIFVGLRFAESLTDKVFDEVFWPRIKAKFGEHVSRQ